MPRNPHARSILVRRAIAASLLSTLVLLGFGHRPTQAQAPPATPPAGPFGPTDFDAVYSDRSWVHYRVSRTCLADVATCLGQPGQTSLCSAGQPITGLSCAAGVHRFCQAKGQLSGWGVETAGDPSQVDITCVRAAAAETRTLAHAELQAQHAGCTTAMPGLACASAADRYCRTQNGFTLGFGPLERNASVAVITCVRTDASTAFGGVAASEVEAYAAGCALGAPEVSTACRQAMHGYCQAVAGPAARGGIGPREWGPPSAPAVYLGCVKEVLPWRTNAALPDAPALPIDVLNKRVDPALGPDGRLQWDPTPVHNTLGAARSFSFDGRVFTIRQLVAATDPNGRKIQFNVQTPEIFESPLSQRQPAGRDRSYEVEPWADTYDFEVPAEYFHASSGGRYDTASVAICDPHRDTTVLDHANEQQSVPSRVNNPFACNAQGGLTGALDHDCYEVTIVGVYQQRPTSITRRDELWGRPVRVVIENPKRAGVNGQPGNARARVSRVDVLGEPRKAPGPSVEQGLLEPNITGDGRLIVIQRNGMIQYSVMPRNAAPCDVTQWGTFRELWEMNGDPLMSSYGIAKYPVRDHENNLLTSFPSSPPEARQVRAAYPWIDRDGDNMMFMLGAATLFYVAPGTTAPGFAKYPVLGHPVFGDQPVIPGPDNGSSVALRPANLSEVVAASDDLPRVGLTLVGLWTQGKMFSPDNRSNAVDFGVPGGPWHHRMLSLYSGPGPSPSPNPSPTPGTEVGTSVRTDINSAENQLFAFSKLRPDTPREVVWFLSTQYPGVTAARPNEHPETAGGVTDEVDFDDVLDPRALIVSSMNPSIRAVGPIRNRFQDGFVYAGSFEGGGFQFPAHIANSSAAVSAAVGLAVPGLAANVQWNAPPYGYLLGGARSEPIAAGGFHGKGLWLDGVDDRLEYIVPPQPPERATDMAQSAWFYNLAIDPRSNVPMGRARLLSLPDGTWLELVGTRSLQFGNAAVSHTVTLPAALDVSSGRFTTLGILSELNGPMGSAISVSIDGYLFATVPSNASLFRMRPGVVTVGAPKGGLRGWVDDFKVIGRRPGAEVTCNHARGTLIGVDPGDPLDARAGAYPATSHAAISSLLSNDQPHFPRYACERPIDAPADHWDLADYDHYTCLGQTRRPRTDPDSAKCLHHALLFPEGPLFFDLPRPSSVANTFCTSCHVNSNPSITMRAGAALSAGTLPMHQEVRRQPMQNSPKFFGNVPAGLFDGLPSTPFVTGPLGVFLDPYTTPSSTGVPPPEPQN